MLTKTLLNQIKNAEIDVETYNPASRIKPSLLDIIQRRESLLKNGLIYPIIVTGEDEQKPLIVDGCLRYELIRELKSKGKWNVPIVIQEIPFEKAKDYRDIQTHQKSYTKIQLAIYATYNYWDDVEKASQQRQNSGTKATAQKGKTSTIVGNMGGVSEKYVEYAHKLLTIDREFFYNLLCKHHHSIKKKELKLLTKIKDKGLVTNIVEKMKSIFENTKNNPVDTEKNSIFSEAFTAVVNSNGAQSQDANIEQITDIDDSADNIVDDKKSLNKKSHDRNAAKMLESKKLISIGITFPFSTADEVKEAIINTLKHSKMEPKIINTAQDLADFHSENK